MMKDAVVNFIVNRTNCLWVVAGSVAAAMILLFAILGVLCFKNHGPVDEYDKRHAP